MPEDGLSTGQNMQYICEGNLIDSRNLCCVRMNKSGLCNSKHNRTAYIKSASSVKNAVTSSIFVLKEQWIESRQLCLPILLQLLITRL
jgi:hypothetical protein